MAIEASPRARWRARLSWLMSLVALDACIDSTGLLTSAQFEDARADSVTTTDVGDSVDDMADIDSAPTDTDALTDGDATDGDTTDVDATDVTDVTDAGDTSGCDDAIACLPASRDLFVFEPEHATAGIGPALALTRPAWRRRATAIGRSWAGSASTTPSSTPM